MRYLVLTLFIIVLSLVFSLKEQGFLGALILGLSVITVDFCCLWIRIRLLQKSRTSLKMFAIIGVLTLRLLNVLIFVVVGTWWLNPVAQQLFYWFVITIPIWNLLGAIQLADQT